ncbi:hypothetical protein L6452_13853 [Arctium lappa]|uniref:Uncharacterized protein n=1 Tax=Arctium lappa TaxID=4217 RepID=A0ACB9CJG2_ARCLA|nr:hypothetical protein L6452_13853 [Arctium lappa]
MHWVQHFELLVHIQCHSYHAFIGYMCIYKYIIYMSVLLTYEVGVVYLYLLSLYCILFIYVFGHTNDSIGIVLSPFSLGWIFDKLIF